MLKFRDIIITGIQSWNISIGSNIKNIAIELSRKNRVLFVSPPVDRISGLMRKQSLRRENQKFKNCNVVHSNLHQINANLYVLQPKNNVKPINRIPFDGMFDYFNKQNNKNLAQDIVSIINYLGFCNYVHICDSDLFGSYYLKELLNPTISVYYLRDNLSSISKYQKQGRRMESLFFKKADLVLTNSVYLAKKAKDVNEQSYFVGQGTDVFAYSPNVNLAIPDELKNIKGPVIGYMGFLSAIRLNVNVLIHIAESRPEWKIALIGSEDKVFKKSVLHKMPNVIFTGLKKKNELAEYLNRFDVAINPQLVNDITIGNYPRKIDEYLAMGKPVVATKMESMEYFEDYISLVEVEDDWVKLIEKELLNDEVAFVRNRIAFATSHTWKNNVMEIGRRIILREEEICFELVDFDNTCKN